MTSPYMRRKRLRQRTVAQANGRADARKQARKFRKALLSAYGSRCFYCGADFAPRDLTVDHFAPLSRGGDSAFENLRLACSPCNSKKGQSHE